MIAFSSNYTLYGDMSRRMNEVYQRFALQDRIEVYLIDESFLDMTDIAAEQREERGRDMRSTVSTWTGIPTCVGIGPTKTLAKLANKIAKSTPQLRGVCDLTDAAARAEWLPLVELADIWGVGRAARQSSPPWAAGRWRTSPRSSRDSPTRSSRIRRSGSARSSMPTARSS